MFIKIYLPQIFDDHYEYEFFKQSPCFDVYSMKKKVNFSVFILFLQVTFGSALLILQISLPLTFSYSEFKFGSEQVSA